MTGLISDISSSITGTIPDTALYEMEDSGTSKKHTLAVLRESIGGTVNRETYLGGMPALAGFTQGNVSGTRFVSETAGKAIHIGDTNTTSGMQIHGIYKSAPSSPYRVAIALRAVGQTVNYLFPTAGWRESSSGKLYNVALSVNANSNEIHSWNSLTSRSTAIGANSNIPPANWPQYGLGWLGLRDDGTNVYFEYSPDGCKDTFVTLYNRPKLGAFITTFDQIFVGMFQETATARRYQVIVRAYDENGLTRTY